ncbi:hypothetical protein BJX99DRAFT_260218 [Aspergillus californicus]
MATAQSGALPTERSLIVYRPTRGGALPAADVARILDKAQVSHILWGVWAVGLFGFESFDYPVVEFVTPDDEIEAAKNAIIAAGFPCCSDARCMELTDWQVYGALPRYHEVADEHFHIESKYEDFTVLSLLKSSRILYDLPPIKRGPVEDNDPTFMFSNDPRITLRHGLPQWYDERADRYEPWIDLYPVKILKLGAFAKALALLLCRDLEHPRNIFDKWVTVYGTLLGEYMTDDKILTPHGLSLQRDVDPKYLPLLPPGPCKPPFRAWRRALRDKLRANNELPERLPFTENQWFGKRWFEELEELEKP